MTQFPSGMTMPRFAFAAAALIGSAQIAAAQDSVTFAGFGGQYQSSVR